METSFSQGGISGDIPSPLGAVASRPSSPNDSQLINATRVLISSPSKRLGWAKGKAHLKEIWRRFKVSHVWRQVKTFVPSSSNLLMSK